MELTRSQKEIQKAAREFARGEFDRSLALDLEKRGAFPETIRRKAADLGFIGLHWPEKYDGGGLGLLETALVAEVFCRQDSTLGAALTLAGLGAECLLRFGSEALKAQWLPPVAGGRAWAAMASGEPGVGADLAAIQTTVAREGDHYRIDGRKHHVLAGAGAGFYIVLARTAAGGSSMILVEQDREGITIHGSGKKLGLNMTGSAELQLDGVRVPADHLVGAQGQGLAQWERFLADARIVMAAQAAGIAAGALDRALAYVKTREAFNRKLAAFEITRHKIAEMTVQAETAHMLTCQAARQGEAVLAAIAKMVATRAAVAVADEAIQLFGGYGYMKEYEVERFYRDAKTLALMLGGVPALKRKIADEAIGRR